MIIGFDKDPNDSPEARLRIAEGALLRAQHEIENTREALTAERQRREAAEAALRPFADVASVTNNTLIINKKSTDLTPLHFTIVLGQWRAAHAHFSRYVLLQLDPLLSCSPGVA